MKYLLEKKNFYKIGDLVLLEYWYNSMITVVRIDEIFGKKYKINHNTEPSKIKEAPSEIINYSDIIDIYRSKN